MGHWHFVMNDDDGAAGDAHEKGYGWVKVFDNRRVVVHRHDVIVSSTPYPRAFVS